MNLCVGESEGPGGNRAPKFSLLSSPALVSEYRRMLHTVGFIASGQNQVLLRVELYSETYTHTEMGHLYRLP